MTHILHRNPQEGLPVAVAGDGVYVIDRDGKRYLDACGGAAVCCLGYSDPDVRRAIKDQVDRLPYAHTTFFSSEPAEELADMLVANAPQGLGMVYLVSGGSEAVEAALKLARQYFVERGEPQRRRFIARRQSYHGNTLGALSVGGNVGRRVVYEPLLTETTLVSPCYAYREKHHSETEEAFAERLADELERTILELGPDTVIGFVAETIVGATLGSVPPVPGYFKRVREVCDRYGILLILDEVMSGMGRSGTLHACEQEGISPDLMTVAKGLGAGYQPIGAVLIGDHVVETIRSGSGAFKHGHTYIGHATACAAALAVQKAIHGRDLLSNVRRQGKRFAERLVERFGNHPYVGDVRGRGLFQSIEMVADRATKEPFDPALKVNVRIRQAAMARGLMCYPAGGTADGRRGDHVLLAPAFIVTEEQIDTIVERLGEAVDAAVADVRG